MAAFYQERHFVDGHSMMMVILVYRKKLLLVNMLPGHMPIMFCRTKMRKSALLLTISR